MSPVLEIADVHLSYGAHEVLRGVDLALGAGELVGLVGPNGAGKSSLLRCIAGLVDGMRGRIAIGGNDVRTAALQARMQLGFAVEPDKLPPLLTGRQCLELIADLRGADRDLADSLALSAALGLERWLGRAVEEYSLGTRQKLAIVLALLGQPKLLVLDEVLNGLDPLAALALKQALRERCAQGATVILATHGLEVAERFLDRCVLLLEGRIAADWNAADLAAFRADPHGGLEYAVVERLRATV